MNVLHVDSSALGANSVSRQLGAEVIAALRASHPALELRYRDLAAEPLAHWAPASGADDAASEQAAEVLAEFLAAEVVVVGAPMYNFAIPSALKAWIDRIAVAGKTFRYGEHGPEGLAGGKRVIVVSTRGGAYSEGAARAMDHQESYLSTLFGFLGIADVEFIRAENLARGEGLRAHALASARARIGADAALAA